MLALLNNRAANFTRGLGLLLVVFILYGTTVEAAHRHGRILPASVSAASHVDNPQTTNLASNKTGCSDCLICQLHQNFTTTLIALRLDHRPAQQQQKATTVAPRDLLSQIVSPLAGRGPPQAS